MFITFEGGEGTGKTTLIEMIKKELKKQKKDVITTREPGGTGSKLAEKIRDLVLDKDYKVNPYAEALLYAASRAQHLDEIVLPALKENKIVLCDRYLDSSIAYQGYARDLGVSYIKSINEYALKYMPNLTFYIDLDPNVGIDRIKTRKKNDRLDQETMLFHKKTREGYLKIANEDQKRIIVIDGTKTIDEIKSIMIGEINKRV